MEKIEEPDTSKLPPFGRRKISPRVCVIDSKQHIRTFLIEAFEDLGFITCECATIGDLGDALENRLPDILVFGLSAGGIAASELLRVLATKAFNSRVLLTADTAPASWKRSANWEMSWASRCCRRSSHLSDRKDCAPASPHFCRSKRRRAHRSTWPKPCARAGVNFGTSRRLTPAVISCSGRGPHPHSTSDLGRHPAGLFDCKRRRSPFARPVGVRHKPRHQDRRNFFLDHGSVT